MSAFWDTEQERPQRHSEAHPSLSHVYLAISLHRITLFTHYCLQIVIGVGCHFNCCRHALTWLSQETQNQH